MRGRRSMKEGKPTPYNKRPARNVKKAYANTKKTVAPVAKDTNKTRRKMVKPTKKPTIMRGKM